MTPFQEKVAIDAEKAALLDRRGLGSLAAEKKKIGTSWHHGQRLLCQILGLWVIGAWAFASGMVTLGLPANILVWFDAWGRWGIGGHWYLAIPLGVLLLWQGSRPRFFQGLVMLLASLFLLVPAVLTHFFPALEMGLLVLGGIALVGAAQVWPLVERLGGKAYVDRNAT